MTATWRMRDGTTIPVRKMEDSHLVNTIAYLRRNQERLRLRYVMQMGAYAENAPDGAALAVEQAIDEITEAEPEEVLESCVAAFPALRAEAKRRRLWVEAS